MCSPFLPDWHALPSSSQLKCETRCESSSGLTLNLTARSHCAQLRTPAVGKTGAAFGSWMSERTRRQ
jgi:hypothetical protein